MKVITLLILFLVFTSVMFTQDIQHEVTTINIEIPVRVFSGEVFVDHLSLEDFEVYEDGILQTIEAVYLIKKETIKRKEERRKFNPVTTRNFYLLFEIAEYTPKLADAIQYFVKDILLPGDNLTLITPVKAYRMKSETLATIPKAALVQQFQRILKKDSWMGNSEYRSALEDLELSAVELLNVLLENKGEAQMLTTLGRSDPTNTGAQPAFAKYARFLEKIDNLRNIDQKRLLDFADYLKQIRGQKVVFLFYQREYTPQIEPRLLIQYQENNQDEFNNFQIASLFDYYHRDVDFNVDLVEQAFSDSTITIHFMFFTSQRKQIPGIQMVEHSEDIFSAFSEMAYATGGFINSSANPEYLFHKAVDSLDNYYLLYYRPRNFHPDNRFKRIEVKVKNGKYRISHRAGYYSK